MRIICFIVSLLPVLLLLTPVPASPAGMDHSLKFSMNTPYSRDHVVIHHSGDYDTWHLAGTGLSREAFDLAVEGYDHLFQKGLISNTSVLTIIDYSKPSTAKRFYILDMRAEKILVNTLVAHGRNSGYNYANAFSNEVASYKSSLGFYITGNTYTGANGYSLQLMGCQPGINDKAMERAVVLHGATYVSEAFIRSRGYLGRSQGCPAVPIAEHKRIINIIKNGSCMFFYHPVARYNPHSTILDS